MITAVIFVLAVASQGLAGVQSSNVDATAICEDKSSLFDRSGLEFVAKQLKDGAECPEDTKAAIIALDDIVSHGSHDVCSMDNVNMIVDFFKTHIQSHHQLPHSFKNFAKSYFMQVSHACKDNMINVFTHEVDDLIENDEQVDVDGGEVIDELVNIAASRGEIVLPSAVAELLARSPKEKLDTDSEYEKYVHEIKETCSKQFKPIYEGVIRPIVVLAQTGIEYPNTETLKEFSISEEQRKKLDRITAIVNLCETIQMYHDDADESHHVQLKPLAKVGIDKIEPKSADVLEKLLDASEAERQQLKDDVREAIKTVLDQEFHVDESDELTEIIVCSRITIHVEHEEGLETPTDAHKPVACGKKSSMSPAFMVLFAMTLAIAASAVL